MSARQLEAFLARIYVDALARAAFKANPRGEALRAGLSREECSAVENMDWVGLELASRSFAKKRQSKLGRNRPRRFLQRVHRVLLNLWQRLRFN